MATYDQLISRVNRGDKSILNDPAVSKVKNGIGNTPLHWAALKWEDALKHPDISRVQNNFGDTPLHWAASRWESAAYHQEVRKVRNHQGELPCLLIPNNGVKDGNL